MNIEKEKLTHVLKLTLCTILVVTLALFSAACTKTPEGEVGNSSLNVSSDIDSNESSSENSDISSSQESEPIVSETSSEVEEETIDMNKYVKPAPNRNRTPITITEVKNNGTKNYVERMGVPYLQYGVQITTGRSADEDEAFEEEFYKKSAELGFKTVLKAVKWKDVEPQENVYNMYTVSQILKNAEKYDLMIELLWFGGNVCGDSTYTPEYVKNDKIRFPFKSGSVLDFTSAELINRESKALTEVLNYLYDNDVNRRVSIIQIENEPTAANCWVAQLDAFLNYMDKMGQTVKNSCYRTVTRVNLSVNDDYLKDDFELMGKILALEGIDMVGPDVYTRDLEHFVKYINRFTRGDMEGNIMHIAEGPGQIYNYSKIVTTCFANNSGYYTYELKSYGGLDFDFGIFRNNNNEWIKRDGTKKALYQWDMITKFPENVTDDITVFNGMVNSVATKIAKCSLNHFKGIFRGKTEKIGTQEIMYDTSDSRVANRIGAVFLADDGYYYMFTPASSATFTFKNKSISGSVSIGAFVNGEWKETATIEAVNGNVLNVKTGVVYRVSANQLK